MKKLLSASVFASIMLCGCAFWWEKNPTHIYQMSIDLSTMTPHQASIIVAAADEWSAQTNNFIFFETSQRYLPVDPNGVIVNIRGEAKSQIEGSGHNVGECWWHGENSDLIVPNDVDDDLLRRISLHELGHSIGLKHPEEIGQNTFEGEVMTAVINHAAHDITCADLQQLCNVAWKGDYIPCEWRKMPLCQESSK